MNNLETLLNPGCDYFSQKLALFSITEEWISSKSGVEADEWLAQNFTLFKQQYHTNYYNTLFHLLTCPFCLDRGYEILDKRSHPYLWKIGLKEPQECLDIVKKAQEETPEDERVKYLQLFYQEFHDTSLNNTKSFQSNANLSTDLKQQSSQKRRRYSGPKFFLLASSAALFFLAFGFLSGFSLNRPISQSHTIATLLTQYQDLPKTQQNATRFYQRGTLFYLQKDPIQALSDYRIFLELTNGLSGSTSFPEGTIQEIQTHIFKLFPDLQPHSSPLEKDLQDLKQEILKEEKKEVERTIADFTEILRLNPKNAIAYYHRGLAKQAQGDFDGAIQDYTQIVSLDPQVAVDAYYHRG
ncbi:MAG: tetratricopeptide repeat protein, partial [Planctomycetota bacterium]